MSEDQRQWLREIPQDRANTYVQQVAQHIKKQGLLLGSEAGKLAVRTYMDMAQRAELDLNATEGKNTSKICPVTTGQG
ncbi:hypothetical protein DWB77_00157 [Streptomyces hundungensis]|uniref:Uncharacterized protein n=1 Tax=Streptomyces hundungensis TaxID=1077946 RepID=A0A387HAR8_9ACTN|nr:hypothetical protein [Streptomyces hundungensis]AYG78050.1 hypothetical protein DWB77_00157 [Streptomyces hundungensis]